VDYPRLLHLLERDAELIRLLVEGVPRDQAHWRPAPESWSILEVISHLGDEEREDFRTRLDIILHRPEEPWPPIDPQGWVVSRKYSERDLGESLAGFLSERRDSLAWLRGLATPNWESVVHSQFGSMRAGDMFCAWVTHDQLHMRQLVELHRAYTQELASPYSLEYAGPW